MNPSARAAILTIAVFSGWLFCYQESGPGYSRPSLVYSPLHGHTIRKREALNRRPVRLPSSYG
jgi:hypothetical protein